jgi:hypothetical protein
LREKKINIINIGLENLEKAAKQKKLWNTGDLKQIFTLQADLHMTLSTIYDNENNDLLSVNHMILGMQHLLHNDNYHYKYKKILKILITQSIFNQF